MPPVEIHQSACLADNFNLLLRYGPGGEAAAIDAPNAEALRKALASTGWRLTHILVTHHHYDHTDGILPLKAETGCRVIGPKAEADKIKGLDQTVAGGERFKLGDVSIEVMDTPGHTLGHISFYLPEAGIAFVADTLFSLGCGRLLEGDPKMMWASLQKLAALPPATKVYCGHEYTASNARFAVTVEPGNAVLAARASEVRALRAEDRPTLPTTIAAELAANPFLRAASPEIRAKLGMAGKADWEVFAELRERKNRA